ncbi:hypothetical protein [Curtobacterium sp. Leaf261]|uniref:hypothetical protein n=1 Tax=Curtobacterium sp. Leaf261 TaxID=1736311 RepID=UPI0006FD4820|nr:hypothetical protein [Curtobacterium sp. Leaf261]KQO59990.1 hypothetical protein ASF23_15165 [Curtobacterium sp. Leaf261]
MQLDTVLQRDDSAVVLAELVALRSPRRVLARGVHHGPGERPWQFQVLLDESDRSWVFDRQRETTRYRYREGVLHTDDGPAEVSFDRSGIVAPPVRMLTPEALPLWGRGPESFSPMLVQRVGGHSLLITFEHTLDPADRQTLVIDERDGAARRWYRDGAVTVITDVREADQDESNLMRPRFARLDGWLPPEY